MSIYAPSRVIDSAGNLVAILPTWSDGGLLSEALGNCTVLECYYEDGLDGVITAREIAQQKGDVETDVSGMAALTRLRGKEFANAFYAARLGPHPTIEAANSAMREFRANHP